MSHARSDAINLLIATLREPGNDVLLRQVRKRRREISAATDENQEDFSEVLKTAIIDRQWASIVFAAVDDSDSSIERVSSALNALVDNDEIEIGRMFRDWVENVLPDPMSHFPEFEALPPAPASDQRWAAESLSTRAGGKAALRLAIYGLTPLTIFYAAQAVSNILDRESDVADGALSQGDVIDEISDTCNCARAVASHLLVWLTRAADYVNVFPGFETSRIGDEVQFYRPVHEGKVPIYRPSVEARLRLTEVPRLRRLNAWLPPFENV